MKVIDLLNMISKGEIEDKRTFNIRWKNGIYRSIYYDKKEKNCMCCLKNVSDDYSIYDDVSFDTEIETPEEDKKIESLINCVNGVLNGEMSSYYEKTDLQVIVEHNFKVIQEKINEIIDYINKEVK